MPGDDRSAADVCADLFLGTGGLQPTAPTSGLQNGCTDETDDDNATKASTRIGCSNHVARRDLNPHVLSDTGT